MKMKKPLIVFLTAGFSAMLVHAVDTSWIGGLTGDWHDNANWSAGIPNTADDRAFINTPAVISLAQNATVKTIIVNAPSTITVASGTELFLSNAGAQVIEAVESLTIGGGGTLRLSTSGTNYADLRPFSGKTIRLDVKIVSEGGIENNYAGTVILTNPANDFPGDLTITASYGTIEFTDIAAISRGTQIIYYGQWSRYRYTGGDATINRDIIISTSGDGRDINFDYTGTGTLTINGNISSGNSTGKAITFYVENPASSIATSGNVENGSSAIYYYKGGLGTLVNNGTLSYTGNTAVNGDGGTFIVAGTAAGTTGGTTVNGRSVYILTNAASMGTGAVTLNASDNGFPAGTLSLHATAQTGTGALTMQRGTTLAVSDSATLNNAAITMQTATTQTPIKPTRIILNATGDAATWTQTIPALTVTETGPATIHLKPALAGAGTLNIGTLTVDATSNLDILAPAIGTTATSVFIGSLDPSPLLAGITVNGLPAAYDATLGLIPAPAATADYAALPVSGLPVSGATITATADAATINAAGTPGDLTLDNPDTAVGALVQDWIAAPAAVDLGNGTLTTPAIAIAANGNALTLHTGTVTAPAAGLLLDNQSAAHPLTLNATLTDNTDPLNLTKDGPGTVSVTSPLHTGTTTILDGTLAIEVPAGDTHALASAAAGAPGAALAKTGAGTLELNTPGTFAGEIVVAEGTLRASVTGALGTTGNGTTVLPGAQLDVGSAYHGQELFTLSGAGPDGSGALVSSGYNYNALMNGRLAADATIGTHQTNSTLPRIDFRGGAFDFAGHTLTKTGIGDLGFTYMKFSGITDTTAIDLREGSLITESLTDWQGSSANTLTIRDGAVFDIYDAVYPFKWSIDIPPASTASIRTRAANSRIRNIFEGPVNVPADSTLIITNTGTYSTTFRSPITGGGSLLRVSGGGETYLYATNELSNITISSGGLHAYHPESLGPNALTDPEAFNLNAWLYMYTDGDGTWTGPDVIALANTATYTPGSTLVVHSQRGTLDLPGGLPKPANWRFLGDAQRTLTGPLTHGENRQYGATIVQGGTLTVTDPTPLQYPGMIEVANGALTFASDTPVEYLLRTDANITVRDSGTLNLEGPVTLTGPFRYRTGFNSLTGGGKSTVNLSGGARLNARVYIGDAAGSAAAIYVHDGGTLDNLGHVSTDGGIGINGHGYVEINDGEFLNHGWSYAGFNPSGIGAVRLNGGRLYAAGGTISEEGDYWEGRFDLSRGGTGTVHLAGSARMEITNNVLNIGSNSSSNGQRGGHSSLTLQDDAFADILNIDIGMRHDHHSALNLNGGTLNTRYLYQPTGIENTTIHINFNGGTLTTKESNEDGILRGTHTTYLWPRGATFDTAGHNMFIKAPLLKPEGDSVASITLTAGGYGYIAPPHVTISGGGGTGATAIAHIDRSRGIVTNLTLTAHGIGYTSRPTVSFSGGGGVGASGETTIRTIASGGLTKTGDGTLYLQTANSTYTGSTVIDQGILALENANALSDDSGIIINDGSLDLMGNTVTVPSLTLSGTGKVANGKLITAALTKSGDGTAVLNADIAFVSAETYAERRGTPGLWEGRLDGARNLTDTNPRTAITLGTDTANSKADWPLNVTQCYTGYIWNRTATNVTWTLYKNFDDTIDLYLDGALIPTVDNANSWNVISLMNITLTPGPHAIEIRFGQGGGDAGPCGKDECEQWPQDIALGIDFYGRGEKIQGNFVKFEDPGDGSLLTPDLDGWLATSHDPAIHVASGTLGISATPGLWEGVVYGNGDDATTPNPKTAIRLSPEKGNRTQGWGENVTAIYTGYIWNLTGAPKTWTFAKNFDDTIKIWIDGQDLTPSEQKWNEISLVTATLQPGPTPFEVRFCQGGGGAGPATSGWGRMGFGIDFQGRNTADPSYFVLAADPGDGSLFTTTLPEDYVRDFGGVTVRVDAGATFDGGGTTVSNVVFSGAGTVRNATFAADSVISPAGDSAIGTLTLSGATFAAGATYRVTVGANETADLLLAPVPLDLSTLEIVPANEDAAAPSGKTYVIARGQLSGRPTLSGFDSKWKCFVKNGELFLTRSGGTLMLMR